MLARQIADLAFVRLARIAGRSVGGAVRVQVRTRGCTFEAGDRAFVNVIRCAVFSIRV